MSYLDHMRKNTLADFIHSNTPIEKIISINEKPNSLIIKGYVQNNIKEYEVKI